MKRKGALRGKLSGLYLRGKTFWFTYRLNGKKRFHSLGTADYGEAVQKALEIRQKPELTPAAVFAREIEAFIAHKRACNEYSKRSAGVKVHALKELAAATGRANPVQVTTADVTTFYRRLQSRVAESTAQVKHGKGNYRYDFKKSFATHMKANDCPWVTPHVMRHTMASLLASAGVSIYKIAVWLGDDVRVVQKHYAKLSPDDGEIEKAFKS